MASFAGLRGTGSFGTDERPKNFREMILWKNPNGMAPLFAMMAKMRKESVDDPEFNWWEEYLDIVRLQINYSTGFSTTDTTGFTVVSGALQLRPGDVLQVEKTEDATYTNEFILVTGVTSDTVFAASRGAANTTAAPIPSAAYLTKIGNSFEEGSAKASISQRNPTKVNNYCQIFKTAVGQTNTARETRYRTGDAWANDKKRKMFDHSRDIELAFMFGKKYELTSGSFPQRFTGGIRQFIATNVTIFTTTPTVATFFAAIERVFDWDTEAGDERLVYAGNGFLTGLNNLVRQETHTQINFNGVVKTYGQDMTEVILPQGKIRVKTHPLMNRHERYRYAAFVLDPTALIYRPLRDTKFEDNIQTPGTDAREAQWLTEAGLELHFEKTSAYIGNFIVP